MWELLVHELKDAEDVLANGSTKRSWLNKTIMTCKEFETILQTIDTTKTTMLALQGASGKGVSRLPWSIWLAMLKDEAIRRKQVDPTPNVEIITLPSHQPEDAVA
jgi:hypothetical protein